MKIIGVTGITGSGTSTVTKMLTEQGGFPIVADRLVHAAMKRGQPAYEKIIAEFGPHIVGEDGEINRRTLGTMVFGNHERMAALEAILHPLVLEVTQQLLNEARTAGYPFAIIDAPLLIESGMNHLCDSCWLVTASDETRLLRIIARDGLSHEAAQKRLASRPGDTALRPHAQVIIENDGGLDALYKNVSCQMI